MEQMQNKDDMVQFYLKEVDAAGGFDAEMADWLIQYQSEARRQDGTYDEKVHAYKIKDLKYFYDAPDTLVIDDILILSMQAHYLGGSVPFEMLGETILMAYVDVFKRYNSMTVSRLDLGVKSLRRAIQNQEKITSKLVEKIHSFTLPVMVD